MTLTINGEAQSLDVHTVADVVAALGYQGERVAIEHNAAIVRRAAWSDTTVHEGDVLEVVTLIGGG